MSVSDTLMEDSVVEEIVLDGEDLENPAQARGDAAGGSPVATPSEAVPGAGAVPGQTTDDEAADTTAEGGDAAAPDLASDWVTELLDPVSEDMPVGNDPHYGDRFYEIKREIDKLADNDYGRVITLARAILREEGKDLRVAAYHLQAAVYVEGVQGFIDGLAVFAGLLDTFGRYCYPAKDSMRQGAVRWLGNRKMQAYCEEKLAEASAEQLTWITEKIGAINSLLVEQFGDGFERWTALDEILDKLGRAAAERARKAEASSPRPAAPPSGVDSGEGAPETNTAAAGSAQPASAAPAGLPEDVAQPVSEQQLLRHARELIRYLTDAREYGRAAGMARALLWGNLQLPPADGTATSVPGPRAADLLEIRQMLADEEYAAAFTLCEGLLFGPGGRLCLDLQFYAHQAARGMKQRELAQIIENATAGLLQRLPKLVDLSFEDGTPFAQADTRRWLEELAADGGGAVANTAIDDEAVKKVVKAAEKAAGKGKLAAGLAVFAAEKTGHPLTAFRLEMEMAAFCLAHQRADLAVPAFQKLMDRAQRECLASWNPELLAVLAKRYRDALQAMAEQVEEERKPEYEERIEALSAAMCQADLLQASRFL